MKGCPRGSSGGNSRLLIVMSISDADFIGSSGWSLQWEKAGVVVDGCVRRLEVTDPWRRCGGGCLCVHT
jgi:hypothetical protein